MKIKLPGPHLSQPTAVKKGFESVIKQIAAKMKTLSKIICLYLCNFVFIFCHVLSHFDSICGERMNDNWPVRFNYMMPLVSTIKSNIEN